MTPSTGRALRGVLRRVAPVGPIMSVSTSRPEIALTFDDGPDPDSTPRVLDALSAANVPATFFVLASRVQLFPGVLEKVVAAGHEIALHGLDHRAYIDFSPQELAARTARARAIVEEASGTRLRWVRPPYGKLTLRGWAALERMGLDAVLWGPSLWDSREASDTERIDRALTGAASGSIVLAHDAYADHRDSVDDGPAPIVDRGALVERVLTEYRNRGLEPVTLERLVDGARARRSPVFVR